MAQVRKGHKLHRHTSERTINERTNKQSVRNTNNRAYESAKHKKIKHKNTCTVEQELQLMNFLMQVAHQEVLVI